MTEFDASGETLPKLDVGLAEEPRRGEDASLVSDDLGLFGVFDGLGAYEGASTAAKLAAYMVDDDIRKLTEATPSTQLTPELALETLIGSVKKAHEKIVEVGHGAATTATLAFILGGEAGNSLVWLSVGDSRIYLVNSKTGELEQLSKDEGHENVVSNVLGYDSDAFQGVSQSGIVEITGGDRVVLVTDGITGDMGTDVLSLNEVKSALDSEEDATAAAEALIEKSRKRDDKTAIVIDLK